MKKSMICFILILYGASLAPAQSNAALANAASAWLSAIKAKYPDRDYISADGQGPSYDDAEKQALAGMAFYFHTSVEAFTETVAAESETNRGGTKETISTLSSRIRNRTESKEDFLGMHLIRERFGAGEWAAVFAYINRKEAEEHYRSRIETNMAAINALMADVARNNDPLYSVKQLAKGRALADVTKKYIENMPLLNSGKSQEYLQTYTPYLNTIQQLYAEHDKNSRITIAVEFRGTATIGEADKSILRQGVEEAIGRYKVPVQLGLLPAGDAGQNRYALVITLDSRTNAASGLVVGSAAINFTRNGETIPVLSPVEKITELDTDQFVQRAVKYIRDNRVFYQAIIEEINS